MGNAPIYVPFHGPAASPWVVGPTWKQADTGRGDWKREAEEGGKGSGRDHPHPRTPNYYVQKRKLTVKKARRKKNGFLWNMMLEESFTNILDCQKDNKWVPEQIKPEISLEAIMTKLKLSYFGHIKKRQDSLEKTIMLGI